MKKVINFIKKYNYVILTFILAFLIIGIIYKLQDVAPLGRNSMLTVDFFHQYGPMLAELFDRIQSKESLLFSFNIGLGIPFFRNFFNYLSSPINLLMLLFNRNNVVMSYSIIIALKAILSALTCSYYLKKKFNTKSLTLIGLSLLYAFSSYFAAYYWNIMWIDGLYLLPLIILGIENIINKNNGVLYTITLTLMLYTNYFIAYMICIFACIYFIAYLIIKTDKFKIKDILKKCFKFALCSLTSGLLMAWALIPMYEALSSTNATMGTLPTSQYYAFTITEFFKNHLTGINPTVFASDISNSPNVSCGILSIALFILFLLNNKISLKRKIVYTLLLLFLSASFYIAPLDYIWHAFHVPNDLPYRYSFIYSFILILIGAYSLKQIKNISYKKVLISFILCIIFITYVYLSKFDNISTNMIKINYLLITTYFLIYNLYHFYPKLKRLSSNIFILVIIIECILSINHKWDILQYIDEFYYDYNNINTSIKYIKENEDELFYRTEKDNILTFNDGAWYDYYGMTTFSSMAYDNISQLIYDLGMPGNEINSYYYKQNTPIFDLMFNIKYIIGYTSDYTRYEDTLTNNDINTYKNLYTTGLMFGVNNTIKNWKYNYINPFEYQNDFIEYSTNIENTLYRLTLLNKEIIHQANDETIVKYTYINEYDNIYLYTNNSLVNYIIVNNNVYYKNNVNTNDISLNTKQDIYNYYTYDEPYIINELSNNDVVDIYVSYNTYLDEEIDIYTIDNSKFIEAYNILNKNKLNITKFKEHYIEANINLEENKTIYTSIPYDDGWNVYCNGKHINTFKINDSLLGFDLNKGNNNIVLEYKINNFNISLGISISTLIFTITYLIIKKRINR
ncbi:MAG: YfhO family protein [Bacilli bacterium]|nr:YfhO family protein [Bacilli bacterium]